MDCSSGAWGARRGVHSLVCFRSVTAWRQSVELDQCRMDVDLLIAEVFERKVIWQTRHKLHHNRSVMDQQWEQVAKAINTTKESARSRWKGLKDQFRKEVKKTKKKEEGEEGGQCQVSKWPYFTLLHFLKDEVAPSPTASNVKSRPKRNTDTENEEQDNTEVPLVVIHPEEGSQIDDMIFEELKMEYPATQMTEDDSDRSQTPSAIDEKNVRKRKERVQDSVAKRLLLLEQEKFSMLENGKSVAYKYSEDYHFLMSLLPHFKSLKPLQKLKVRNRMTQVLIDEASGST